MQVSKLLGYSMNFSSRRVGWCIVMMKENYSRYKVVRFWPIKCGGVSAPLVLVPRCKHSARTKRVVPPLRVPRLHATCPRNPREPHTYVHCLVVYSSSYLATEIKLDVVKIFN